MSRRSFLQSAKWCAGAVPRWPFLSSRQHRASRLPWEALLLLVIWGSCGERCSGVNLTLAASATCAISTFLFHRIIGLWKMFFGANLNVGVCSEFLFLFWNLSSIKSTSCWLGDHGGSLISASRETSVNFQQTREGMNSGRILFICPSFIQNLHIAFLIPRWFFLAGHIQNDG